MGATKSGDNREAILWVLSGMLALAIGTTTMTLAPGGLVGAIEQDADAEQAIAQRATTPKPAGEHEASEHGPNGAGPTGEPGELVPRAEPAGAVAAPGASGPNRVESTPVGDEAQPAGAEPEVPTLEARPLVSKRLVRQRRLREKRKAARRARANAATAELIASRQQATQPDTQPDTDTAAQTAPQTLAAPQQSAKSTIRGGRLAKSATTTPVLAKPGPAAPIIFDGTGSATHLTGQRPATAVPAETASSPIPENPF